MFDAYYFLAKGHYDDVTGVHQAAAWSHSDDGGNPKSEFLQLILVFYLEST